MKILLCQYVYISLGIKQRYFCLILKEKLYLIDNHFNQYNGSLFAWFWFIKNIFIRIAQLNSMFFNSVKKKIFLITVCYLKNFRSDIFPIPVWQNIHLVDEHSKISVSFPLILISVFDPEHFYTNIESSKTDRQHIRQRDKYKNNQKQKYIRK